MTLDPTDDAALALGWPGPKLTVGPRCANPFCNRFADHAHHVFRRSLLKGAFDWVKLTDDTIVANLVPLCATCHDRVTGRIGGHKNAIRIERDPEGQPTYMWTAVQSGYRDEIFYENLAPLEPQPPSPGSPDESATTEGMDTCPVCGQVRRRRSPSASAAGQGERRRRKSWTIPVPDDAEDGANILDVLVDTLAPTVGVEPTKTGRYYVIVAALAHAHHDLAALNMSLQGR